jgi:hypothetical protein
MYDRAANADQLNKDAKPKQKLESGEEVPTDEQSGEAPLPAESPQGEPDAQPATESASPPASEEPKP